MAGPTLHFVCNAPSRRGWRLGIVVCTLGMLTGSVRGQDGPSADDLKRVPPPLQAFLNDVKDDKPVADGGDELNAYNELLIWCFRDVTPEQLAAVARRDISYAHMVNKELRSRYRGQPVHIEGRLKRVSKWPTPDDLKASGLPDEIYESWIFPGVGNTTHPVVVLTPRAAPGVKAEGDTEGWIAVDAYFFKRYAYEARTAQGKSVMLGAPLLIGPILPAVSLPAGVSETQASLLVPGMIVGGLVLAATAIGLLWSVRRADRRVHARLDDHRVMNPFSEAPTGPYRPGAPHSLEN